MIARGLQQSVNATEDAGTCMFDLRHFSMQRCCANDLAAKGLADGLLPEAHTKDRNARRSLGDEIEANASFVRRTGAGREHDCLWLSRHNVGDRDLVIAVHDNIRSKSPQIMEKVEGKAVVVVDQDDHVAPLSQGFTVPPKEGQAGRISSGYCPRLTALAKRRASSAARNKAFALLMHSCCSKLGSLSATIPAPAWTYITPSLISAVRRTMHVSISPAAEK